MEWTPASAEFEKENMSLPMNSLYSLTWGDYSTSLVSAIQLLRCHGDLVDCTLAAGGRIFPAHKIVLCAASPFLLDLLKNTPCKHPVVMLAGVHANDLEALLEFVYRGEVSVDHSQLPSLLQAAQCLNIQGLAPQSMQKDDYTQLHLQQMMPQHHVKTVIDDHDQLIATISAPTQQTVHAQVVEDMQPVEQIPQQKEVTETINQLLPARKRKPRGKKPSPSSAPKILRVEGMENAMYTPTTTTAPVTEMTEIPTTTTLQNSMPIQSIKSENVTAETLVADVTTTPTTPNTINTTMGSTGSSTTPSKSGSKSRRSQSEQPATCPICYAVIRQSRNLRRHLELRHFAKPGVKKERKSPSSKKSGTSAANTSGSNTNTITIPTSSVPQVQSVQTIHAVQTIQVKKEQSDSMGSSSSLVSPAGTIQHHVQQQQQQQHHQQPTAIIDQSGNITHSNNGQQQIVTQTENTDGTTSLSIAQVQTLQGHQILGNINQVNMHHEYHH